MKFYKILLAILNISLLIVGCSEKTNSSKITNTTEYTQLEKDIIGYAPRFLLKSYGEKEYLKAVKPLWEKYGSPAEHKEFKLLNTAGLLNAFKDNEVSADIKYKNKWIPLYGVVTKIGKSPIGTIFIRLQGDTDDKIILFGFEDSIQYVADLKVGDQVSIIGNCRGLILGELNFVDAEINKRDYEAVEILEALDQVAKSQYSDKYEQMKQEYYSEVFTNTFKANNETSKKLQDRVLTSKRLIVEVFAECMDGNIIYNKYAPKEKQYLYALSSFFKTFKSDTFAQTLHALKVTNSSDFSILNMYFHLSFLSEI